jgi:hypothetical protein
MNRPCDRYASEAAAHIVNLYVGSDEPKAITFGKVLSTIQAALEEAKRDLHARLCQPSDN